MNIKTMPRLFKGDKMFKKIICFFLLSLVLLSSNVFAAEVVINWQPSTDPDPGNGQVVSGIGGYKVHRGAISGNYTKVTDVGNVTTWSLDNVDIGTHFYVAVTAYDNAGNESGYSNEVECNVVAPPDTIPPAAPGSTEIRIIIIVQ